MNADMSDRDSSTEASAAPDVAPDYAAVADALTEEYRLLSTMLSTVWSASLQRVSLFLGVVSAIGVALGFVAQDGVLSSTFTTFALVVLPLALVLGLGTFVRSVELQREAYVYITGLNRIRHSIAMSMPATRPYFVLSIHDDATGVYRSQGTGIRLRPPRFQLVFALVQTQGIVALICAALAGIIGGLATALIAADLAWLVAGIGFALVLVGLVMYWRRSFGEIQNAVRPLFPTPPEEVDAAI